MVLTRDFDLQQGDTKKVIIPVFDDDDPNNDFFPNISNATVEFTVASDYGASSPTWTAGAGQINITDFSNVKLGSGAFDFSDVGVSSTFTIPSTQDVIEITIPETETASFATGQGALVYQCRFTDGNGNVLTPVLGSITVDESAPF
jgi:hypothetical protein